MCFQRTRSLIYSYFNDDKYASAPHLSCDNCVWRNSWTPKELQSILLICMRFFIAWAVRVSLPIESFQLATINSMKSLFPMCKKWAPHACKRYFSISQKKYNIYSNDIASPMNILKLLIFLIEYELVQWKLHALHTNCALRIEIYMAVRLICK